MVRSRNVRSVSHLYWHRMDFKTMMRQWRDIQVGDWFATGHQRLNAEGLWKPTTYVITSIAEGYVEFRATHDHTQTHRQTIGWLVDNGHELF